MSDYPTEPGITNVILQGYLRGCVDEVIKVISMISNSNQIFKRAKKGEKLKESEKIILLKKTYSDLTMYRFLIEDFQKLKFSD